MSRVTIFAPSPILTVTVEDNPSGHEVHVHAGGQGVWQARMLRSLGVEVTTCCVLSGETGPLLGHLLADEGFEVVSVGRDARGAAYVHDRRDGERRVIAQEEGDPLGRHDLDELYGVVLKEGIDSQLVILSGPAGDDVLPADTYRRLAGDLRTAGARVVVDLAGERLRAAVEGGVDVLKVSHEELLDDGLIDENDPDQIMTAMRELRQRGAECVVVSRSSDPFLLLDDEGFLEVTAPDLEVVETAGAGDSLTAGITAGMAKGQRPRDAITLAAAAGALNVTRRGLGTADAAAIEKLEPLVRTRSLSDATGPDDAQSGRVSPDGLAALAEEDDR